MLTPLKTLEQKLALLLNHVAQVRADNLTLREENLKLRTQNQHLADRMSEAQSRVDMLLLSLEESQTQTSEGNQG